ncbi:hypothetical protein LWI28_009224 [Acer negundo]|uniref:Uncharacterized protein n=1 Tax=Acer negundo TaxID=4023 RepID=A0AAD5IVG3_ACENE|nr:hypothetical protein LWI28_009224 [Acer negundo]
MVGHYGRNKALKQYFERAVRVAEEAKRAALEAEQKASKEAADREAAEVSKRISAGASKDEAPRRQMVGSSETSNAQSKESGADGIEKSQSAGKFYV